MSLSGNDFSHLQELIELVYSIPDQTLMLETICEKMQRVVPFTTCAFTPINPKTQEVQFNGSFLYNTPAKPVLLFTQHYATVCPFVTSGWLNNRINEAVRLTDLISPAKLVESEYGRDFQPLVPVYWEMGTMLGSQGDPVGVIGIHRQRTERNFTDRQKQIFNFLIPHLSRAIHNISFINEVMSEEGIGVVRMTREGQVLMSNIIARKALDGTPVNALPDPKFENAPLLFKSKTGTYRIRNIFLHTCREKIILLESYPPKIKIKPRLDPFSLSARQEEIALLVVRGLSNRQISERLFITEQTVKDHLRDIFEKVRVGSRGEFMAKVFGTI